MEAGGRVGVAFYQGHVDKVTWFIEIQGLFVFFNLILHDTNDISAKCHRCIPTQEFPDRCNFDQPRVGKAEVLSGSIEDSEHGRKSAHYIIELGIIIIKPFPEHDAPKGVDDWHMESEGEILGRFPALL